MRYSHLFNQTLREAPAEVSLPGDQLLQRAGFFRQVTNNFFITNPLGYRCLQKLSNLIRQELNCIGGQEINIPSYMPGDVFKDGFGQSPSDLDLIELTDQTSRYLFSTSTSLTPLPELISHSVRSHRQLPRLLYQIQPKSKNLNQNPSGLFSSRQVTRLETFFLDKDQDSAALQYQKIMKAFQNIFIRSAIPVVVVDFIYSHPYRQSGSEFFMLHPQGESTLLHCPSCGFWGNQKFSQSSKVNPSNADLKPLDKVHTPGTKTIEDLAKFLNIAKSQTAKAVFMTATMLVNNEKTENVVMAIVRGDKELDENKLLRVINAMKIRPSTDSEIESIGAVPGFASPVGLKDALIVVDDLVPDSPNLVAGANEVDFHFRNVNYQRDFQAQIIADITTISSGDPCPHCQQPLEEQSAFLLGRINAADTQLSTKTNCNFQDENAVMKPILIGSGWLDLEPILGGVAESNHDPFGLIWPFNGFTFKKHE